MICRYFPEPAALLAWLWSWLVCVSTAATDCSLSRASPHPCRLLPSLPELVVAMKLPRFSIQRLAVSWASLPRRHCSWSWYVLFSDRVFVLTVCLRVCMAQHLHALGVCPPLAHGPPQLHARTHCPPLGGQVGVSGEVPAMKIVKDLSKTVIIPLIVGQVTLPDAAWHCLTLPATHCLPHVPLPFRLVQCLPSILCVFPSSLPLQLS